MDTPLTSLDSQPHRACAPCAVRLSLRAATLRGAYTMTTAQCAKVPAHESVPLPTHEGAVHKEKDDTVWYADRSCVEALHALRVSDATPPAAARYNQDTNKYTHGGSKSWPRRAARRSSRLSTASRKCAGFGKTATCLADPTQRKMTRHGGRKLRCERRHVASATTMRVGRAPLCLFMAAAHAALHSRHRQLSHSRRPMHGRPTSSSPFTAPPAPWRPA